MSKTGVINVSENSPEFLTELKRRIETAKKTKNRIPLAKAKKEILAKYRGLVRAHV